VRACVLACRYRAARVASREGRERSIEQERALWEEAATAEIARAEAAQKAVKEENTGLRAALADVAARAERAEAIEAELKAGLETKDSALAQKDGQLQRLIKTCSVLEQKVRRGLGKAATASSCLAE
jgi:chromosome segregation ATPase